MAANGRAQAGEPNPPGHWGKWRGVKCVCGKPARVGGRDGEGLCMSCYNKQRWADGHRPPSITPEARREARLRNRYGIGAADYDRMLTEQGGVCAVCGQPPTKRNTRAHWDGKLCIDHDHDTGQVRGLLCNDCNLVVGYGRTEAVLLAAAAYLRNRA